MINIPVSAAHNRLATLLEKAQNNPILLTSRGKPVGVLLSPGNYKQLRQAAAYIQLLEISHEIRKSASADKIYRASRQELEDRQRC
jgi:prevent-host-death family protein